MGIHLIMFLVSLLASLILLVAGFVVYHWIRLKRVRNTIRRGLQEGKKIWVSVPVICPYCKSRVDFEGHFVAIDDKRKVRCPFCEQWVLLSLS